MNVFNRKKTSYKALCTLDGENAPFEILKNVSLAQLVLGVGIDDSATGANPLDSINNNNSSTEKSSSFFGGGSNKDIPLESWEYININDVHSLKTELAHGAQLETFYEMIIVYVPSIAVYRKHLKDLVALAAELPIVIVCEGFVAGAASGDETSADNRRGFFGASSSPNSATVPKVSLVSSMKPLDGSGMSGDDGSSEGFVMLTLLAEIARLTKEATIKNSGNVGGPFSNASATTFQALRKQLAPLTPTANAVVFKEASAKGSSLQAGTRIPLLATIPNLASFATRADLPSPGITGLFPMPLDEVTNSPIWCTVASVPCWEIGNRGQPASFICHGYAGQDVGSYLLRISGGPSDCRLKLLSHDNNGGGGGANANGVLEFRIELSADCPLEDPKEVLRMLVQSMPPPPPQQQGLSRADSVLVNYFGNGIFQIRAHHSVSAAVLLDTLAYLESSRSLPITIISQCFTFQCNGYLATLVRQERLMREGYTDPKTQLRLEEVILSRLSEKQYSWPSSSPSLSAAANNITNSPYATFSNNTSFGVNADSSAVAFGQQQQQQRLSTQRGGVGGPPSFGGGGGAAEDVLGSGNANVPTMPSPSSQRAMLFNNNNASSSTNNVNVGGGGSTVTSTPADNAFGGFHNGNTLSGMTSQQQQQQQTSSLTLTPDEFDARITAALAKQQAEFEQRLSQQQTSIENKYREELDRNTAMLMGRINSVSSPGSFGGGASASVSSTAFVGDNGLLPANVSMLVESECTRLIAPLYDRLATDYHTKERLQEIANDIISRIPKKDQVVSVIEAKIAASESATLSTIESAKGQLREEMVALLQNEANRNATTLQTSIATLQNTLNNAVNTTLSAAVAKQQGEMTGAANRLRDEVNEAQRTLQQQIQQCTQQTSQLSAQQTQLSAGLNALNNTVATNAATAATAARVTGPDGLVTLQHQQQQHTFPSPSCVTDTVFTTAVGGLTGRVDAVERDFASISKTLNTLYERVATVSNDMTSRVSAVETQQAALVARVANTEQQQQALVNNNNNTGNAPFESTIAAPAATASAGRAQSPLANSSTIVLVQSRLQTLEEQLGRLQHDQHRLREASPSSSPASQPNSARHPRPPTSSPKRGLLNSTGWDSSMVTSPIPKGGGGLSQSPPHNASNPPTVPSTRVSIGGGLISKQQARSRAVSAGALVSSPDDATPATMGDLRKYARKIDTDARVEAMRIALNSLTENLTHEMNSRIDASERKTMEAVKGSVVVASSVGSGATVAARSSVQSLAPASAPGGVPVVVGGGVTTDELTAANERLWANVEALLEAHRAANASTIKASLAQLQGQLNSEVSDLKQKYAILSQTSRRNSSVAGLVGDSQQRGDSPSATRTASFLGGGGGLSSADQLQLQRTVGEHAVRLDAMETSLDHWSQRLAKVEERQMHLVNDAVGQQRDRRHQHTLLSDQITAIEERLGQLNATSSGGGGCATPNISKDRAANAATSDSLLLLSPRFEEVESLKVAVDSNNAELRSIKGRLGQVEVSQLALEPLRGSEEHHLRALKKMLERLQRLEQHMGMSATTSRAPSPGQQTVMNAAPPTAATVVVAAGGGAAPPAVSQPVRATAPPAQQQQRPAASNPISVAAPQQQASSSEYQYVYAEPQEQPAFVTSLTPQQAQYQSEQPQQQRTAPVLFPSPHRPLNPTVGTRGPSPVQIYTASPQQ